jgi:steroid 5-alpha reductase family enzyme
MNSYFAALIAILILANLSFTIAIRMLRNDVADVVWGLGFVVATAAAASWTASIAGGYDLGPRQWIAFACLLVWALRLSSHIAFRNSKKTGEDIRYKKWREEWGAGWRLRSYLQVFILQALILFVNALPLLKIASEPSSEMDMVAWSGCAIWLIGFLFEAISDQQLTVFKAKPESKGKLMTEGLWSWSRHPNYFGEVVQWWGFFLMGVTLPGAWFTVIAPLTITFFILKVSGIPMLEKEMQSRQGFAEYARRTAVFFPRPPRN